MQALAASLAICTWRFSGSMSGARRRPTKFEGSNLRASACACALSSQFCRLPSMRTNTGTLAEYIEMDMCVSL